MLTDSLRFFNRIQLLHTPVLILALASHILWGYLEVKTLCGIIFLLSVLGMVLYGSILFLIPFFGWLQLIYAPSVVDGSLYDFASISIESYLQYTLPALSSITIGIFIGHNKFKHLNFKDFGAIKNDRIEGLLKPSLLVTLGIIFILLMRLYVRIPILGAILWYGSLLPGIALILSLRKRNWLVAVLSILVIFMHCVLTTLFWKLMMWCLIGATFALHRNLVAGITLVLLGPFVLSIGGAVQVYKRGVRDGAEKEILSAPEEIRYNLNSYPKEHLEILLLSRMNQGLHDSHIYASPKMNDKTYGSTFILNSISPIIPRFIWPEKPGFDTRRYIEYTGYTGMGRAFIGHSVVAELNMNFKLFGVLICGFLIGFFIVCSYVSIGMKVGSLLCIIPFFHVLRQEVDSLHWIAGVLHGYIFLNFLVLSAEYIKQRRRSRNVRI